METSIMKTHKDGLEISLMDSSKWRIIHIGDITRTALWYPTQRIKIEKLEEGKYKLTNLDTSAPGEIEVSRIR
ncbi:MAG: hypothetical protein HZC12_10405 [Nitrospirae bacterium]|nr:hypothetical protein [Nitrospirota bacterium]